ncbi:ER membrane complex subunit 6 [Komagataella phaffii CBS 7435]|uniref:ER membrane protein complex subunit 6 n=1 Tax=Komagataella phaffii (strain ATCC 76273 / CBS 7435 / CECT 11047 / NRRL Y-11430 / Wegner 21-1) TaxID=981350 RepID=A0A1G4KQU0_KOMPC|nr:ER membrane complex subunit 6 [Komagataella phaffii CBS 7435]SCV12370.1 ER membrane complex subunit 6 [Komagataella phaffii CBS 7435]
MSKDQVKYSSSITHNNAAIQYVHDVTGLAFGTAAGILKVESLQGVAFFVILSILSNLLFYVLKIRGHASQYFERPLKDIYLKGLTRSISGYLMMWCLVTALCE